MKQAVPLSRYFAFFALTAAVCAADLTSKTWMFGHRGMGMPHAKPTWWLWDGVFGFQTSLNEGALFGLGQGFWPLFAALSVGAAIAIFIWLFLVGAGRDWLLTITMGFVTGGILGNLYDRLGLPGLSWPANDPFHVPGTTAHAVRDFALLMIGPWHWPNFNLADSALVVGAALLVFHAFFTKEKDTGEVENESE